MLSVEGVSKSWGTFRLQAVNLHVLRGEFFVLLGPSGAGKSLLLELIAGFHVPDSGRICVNGVDVTALPPEKRNVGLVCQDDMLFPHKSVRQNVIYGLQVHRVGKLLTAQRLDALAALLHLERLLDRPVAALSGGEKQRVCLARALATGPDLLLLDEPFSSLDPPVKLQLWEDLRDLHRQSAMTILAVTHDRVEARALGERIAVMQRGRIEQAGAAPSVFERPDTGFVAYFTGGKNIYRGTARSSGSLAVFTAGTLSLLTTSEVRGECEALVRPENIIVSREPVRTSARNQLAVTVQSVTRRGDLFEVTASFREHLMTCIVTPLSVEELAIAPGAQVYFSFKAGSVHLMGHSQ